MKEIVWLLRDPRRPGVYLLAIRPRGAPLRDDEVEILPWRTAKRAMEPEEFYRMCRLSFADWLTNHPEVTG
jgi:hypothetical protein